VDTTKGREDKMIRLEVPSPIKSEEVGFYGWMRLQSERRRLYEQRVRSGGCRKVEEIRRIVLKAWPEVVAAARRGRYEEARAVLDAAEAAALNVLDR